MCRCPREVTGVMTRRSDRAILGVAGIVLAGFLALALLAGAGLLDAPANEVVAASSGYGVATPVSAQSAAAAYPAWYDGVGVVGLTAGASVPDELLEPIIEDLRSRGVTTVEPVIVAEETVEFQPPEEPRP